MFCWYALAPIIKIGPACDIVSKPFFCCCWHYSCQASGKFFFTPRNIVAVRKCPLLMRRKSHYLTSVFIVQDIRYSIVLQSVPIICIIYDRHNSDFHKKSTSPSPFYSANCLFDDVFYTPRQIFEFSRSSEAEIKNRIRNN